MRHLFPIILGVVLATVEVAWFFSPKKGSLMGESYRSRERIEALQENAENPSPAARAKVEEEFHLVSRHQYNRRVAILGGLLIGNAVFIACLCKSGLWGKTRVDSRNG